MLALHGRKRKIGREVSRRLSAKTGDWQETHQVKDSLQERFVGKIEKETRLFKWSPYTTSVHARSYGTRPVQTSSSRNIEDEEGPPFRTARIRWNGRRESPLEEIADRSKKFCLAGLFSLRGNDDLQECPSG